jgi:hypothetical protein
VSRCGRRETQTTLRCTAALSHGFARCRYALCDPYASSSCDVLVEPDAGPQARHAGLVHPCHRDSTAGRCQQHAVRNAANATTVALPNYYSTAVTPHGLTTAIDADVILAMVSCGVDPRDRYAAGRGGVASSTGTARCDRSSPSPTTNLMVVLARD